MQTDKLCEQIRNCLLLLAWLSIHGLVHAQQYVEIKAEMELTTAPTGNTNAAEEAKPVSVSVTCTTSTNEWRIDHDYFQKATGDSDRWGLQQWFYDGTNVYNRLEAISLFSGTNVTVNIWPSRDGHPMGDAPANLARLAFCSGSYLQRPGRLVPLPVDLVHHTPDRFGYLDRTETFKDDFGLPRSVELFTSKSLLPQSALDFHKDRFPDGRYEKYDKALGDKVQEGVLTFHYAVQETTNLLGWTFPLRFEFFQKGRSYIQNGDWFHRGNGLVKSIRLTEKPGGLLVPGLQQTIVDWRFHDLSRGVDAITYSWTNDFAAPLNDPVLQERFGQTRERNARGKRGGH